MEQSADLVYAAAGRTILALDRSTGHPVWQFKIPGFFKSGLATLLISGNELYAGRGGYLYCLDRWTGHVLWERGLKGGGGTVLLAAPGADTDNTAPAHDAHHNAAAAAAM